MNSPLHISIIDETPRHPTHSNRVLIRLGTGSTRDNDLVAHFAVDRRLLARALSLDAHYLDGKITGTLLDLPPPTVRHIHHESSNDFGPGETIRI